MNDRGLSVLEQYNLKVHNTYRGRGSLICETDQGLKLIKEFNGSGLRLSFQNRVLQQVKQSGYESVDAVLENNQGALISKDKDEVAYIVKDWFSGRECDTKNERDIFAAVENLAKLHKVMRLDVQQEEERGYEGDLVDEYERHNRELKKVRNFIRDKRKKNEFELFFMRDFNSFLAQGEEVVASLKQSEYPAMKAHVLTEGLVCHGEYNHHNILNTAGGMAVTNFDHCAYDIQLSDLYQLMRKIMEKHNWNEKLGYGMIETYDHWYSLDKGQRSYLYHRLAYPEKFWKIGNHYLNTNKAWIPGKNIEKIQNLVKQESVRLNFLKEIN